MSHVWPGITPLTAYDLELRWWLMYVRAAQRLRDQAEQQRREIEQARR